MKFVNIASANEIKEVSSDIVNRYLKLRRKKKCVYLEQNNNEVIRPIERSEPMNETLSSKDKTDHNYHSHNDVATWSEVLTHTIRVEMMKLGPENFRKKKDRSSQRLE